MSKYGKMTLLELTQAVLDKMDSDEVNSINDTVESSQVAGEIRDTYRSITAGFEDRQREGLESLEGLSDSEYPNQMKIPENVIQVLELWYDSCDDEGNYRRCEPEWMEPYEYVSHVKRLRRDCDQVQVSTVKGAGNACLPFWTDRDPEYYTSFDNKHLVFDGVNQEIDNTLQASKSTIWSVLSEPFLMEDDFVPPLRVDEFPLLLNEAIDSSYVHFKGVSNGKAAQRSREQRVRGQNNRSRVDQNPRAKMRPPFGRRSRGGNVFHSRRSRDSYSPKSY